MDFTSESDGYIASVAAIFSCAFAAGVEFCVAVSAKCIMRWVISFPVPPRVTTFTAAEYFWFEFCLRKRLVALSAVGGAFCGF